MKTFTELLNEAAKEVNEIDIFQLKNLLEVILKDNLQKLLRYS